MVIFCCISIQSSHFLTFSHSESVSARTSYCFPSWTHLLSGILSSSLRRAQYSATATPHWRKYCWWSQGQSTHQTEGTHRLLRVLNFETRFLLVWNQISITTISFHIYIFQVLAAISGDVIILTTSNVFFRWKKQLVGYTHPAAIKYVNADTHPYINQREPLL